MMPPAASGVASIEHRKTGSDIRGLASKELEKRTRRAVG